MKWAELVLKYIEALAWPTVVVFALLKYQRPLKELLGRLRKADALGASFDFESEITEAAVISSRALQRSAARPPVEPSTVDGDSASLDSSPVPDKEESAKRESPSSQEPSMRAFNAEELDRLLALAATERFEAIRQAWDALQLVIDGVDDYIEFTKPNMLGVKERKRNQLLAELNRLGVIGSDVNEAVDELREVYTSAVFGTTSAGRPNVSLAAVTTYITTAYRIANAIAEAGNKAYWKLNPV